MSAVELEHQKNSTQKRRWFVSEMYTTLRRVPVNETAIKKETARDRVISGWLLMESVGGPLV